MKVMSVKKPPEPVMKESANRGTHSKVIAGERTIFHKDALVGGVWCIAHHDANVLNARSLVIRIRIDCMIVGTFMKHILERLASGFQLDQSLGR